MKLHIEELIRNALKTKKMNVSDLARELGISRVTIYNLFEGQFSRKLIQQVSQFLSIPVHILMMEDPYSAAEFDQKLVRSYHASTPNTKSAVNSMLHLENKSQQTLTKKPKIIVVDDVKENVELLVRMLRKDFDVLDFTDPVKALEAIKREAVDAVITDQRMPGMTGTSLLKQVSEMERSILKFIVSAYTDKDGLMDAINDAHADAFFVKPFKPAEIKERMQQMLLHSSHIN